MYILIGLNIADNEVWKWNHITNDKFLQRIRKYLLAFCYNRFTHASEALKHRVTLHLEINKNLRQIRIMRGKDKFTQSQQGLIRKKITFSLSASHFLFHFDCFNGKTATSVLVLLSKFDEVSCVGAECSRRFLLPGVPFNSSNIMPYPFLAKSTGFASFIFWMAGETFDDKDEAADLTLLKTVSALSLEKDCCCCCCSCWVFADADSLLSLVFLPEVSEWPLDPGVSSFPVRKLDLTYKRIRVNCYSLKEFTIIGTCANKSSGKNYQPPL